MSNADRIAELLAQHPDRWYDDDELALTLGIRPRQTVNQVCRRLAAAGFIRREKRGMKICNAAAHSFSDDGVAAARPAIPTEHPVLGPTGTAERTQRVEAVAALIACADLFDRRNLGDVSSRLREASSARNAHVLLRECRWALERLLGQRPGRTLVDVINAWPATEREDAQLLRHHMHTVRTLGNEATHGQSVQWPDVVVAARALSVVAARL